MVKKQNEKTNLYIYIFLAALTFVVYLRVLGNEFINYDDNDYVTQNTQVQSGLTYNSIKWAFVTNCEANWHPLTWLSHMVDCELFGLRSWGHHLINLLIHIANVLLLFWVLKTMTGTVWPSVFVAAVFAIHPLNVESVAWIAERKNVLSTLFWILVMAGYWRYAKDKSVRWYAVTLVLFALGLMAKPMLVTLPFILLLLDYWPIERLKSLKDWKTIRVMTIEKIPFFALSVISCIVTFVVQKAGGSVAKLDTLGLSIRSTNAVISYVQYIVKMFWPGKLAIIYPLQPEKLKVLDAAVALVILITVSILVIVLSKKHRYLLMGWLWYIIALLPVIGLIQVGSQSMADRYAYVPLIGIFVAIAWGISELSKRCHQYQNIVLGLILVLITGFLSGRTVFQLQYWHDDVTLFKRTIDVTKDNFVAYEMLGYVYAKKGDYGKSIEASKEAIRINPSYCTTYGNLGNAYIGMGNYEKSIEASKEAIRLNRDYFFAYGNLGYAYARLGDYGKSIEASKEAIRLNPEYYTAYINLGAAYIDSAEYEKATKAFNEAIKINPLSVEAHLNLGYAYLFMDNKDAAMEEYRILKDLNPQLAEKLLSEINK